MRVVLEVEQASFPVQSDLPEEEAEGVEPGEEHAGDDFSDAFFAETEVVAADDGGIDEEHSALWLR